MRPPPVQPVQGYTTLEWLDCAALLEAHKNDAFELETFVAMTGESTMAAFGELKSGKDISNQIAQLLWDISGYRFIYKKSKKSSASDSVVSYSYYCAQNEAEVKKSTCTDEDVPISITVDNDNLELPVRLKHHQSHLNYVDISIGGDIGDFVEDHKHDSAANNPTTEVTQKQIYALWSELNEGERRLDNGQVKSAQMILEKFEDRRPFNLIRLRGERLAENKPPAAYDPRKAHGLFDFIDPTWAPGVSAVYADEDEKGDGMLEDGDEQPGTQMPGSDPKHIGLLNLLKRVFLLYWS
ncbi:hypothetical protein B0H14DRAFT_2585858 [Mycena olivaceomarginata]|nr:hypothetical protein B0H14DRAFT_2585858 [Mycena olivaceomarginata]